MYSNLAILALFALLFSVIAGRVERGYLTTPMIYIFFGLLAGPLGLGLLDLKVEAVEMRVIADLTLALVLFLDAANADLRALRRHALLPRRMLMIGLPLCIALGALAGAAVFPELSIWEACLLATMLAATDAALGKSVVTNEEVPGRLRQAINVESGLNDGLCVPVLFVFLALATGQVETGEGAGLALELVAREVGIGIAVAAVLVTISVQLMRRAQARGWFTEVWVQIPVVALALACFATAQALEGSGFIASFVGGLLFGYFAREKTHQLVLAAEDMGEMLEMLTWVVFSSVFLSRYWSEITPDVLLYSLLSLTVVRMIPVLVALSGTGEPLEARLFLAWFGPRGLASIVFLVIAHAANLPSESVLIHTVICTITLCVVAHGVTAHPWARRLGRKLADD